ncbi:RBM41 protein, partial [Atractosteus spatula]|nr:RBM41 protein [Atractosteus spatula]
MPGVLAEGRQAVCGENHPGRELSLRVEVTRRKEAAFLSPGRPSVLCFRCLQAAISKRLRSSCLHFDLPPLLGTRHRLQQRCRTAATVIVLRGAPASAGNSEQSQKLLDFLCARLQQTRRQASRGGNGSAPLNSTHPPPKTCGIAPAWLNPGISSMQVPSLRHPGHKSIHTGTACSGRREGVTQCDVSDSSVSRHSCEDAPAPEEQETEGQRQLRGLLLQQLDTAVDLDRCVAKRKCFAPAALYKPFGEQAAGVRSLSEFQALQDGEQELASLRELGLTDAEIELWLSRDALRNAEKRRGVSAAPGAREERLQQVEEKLAARRALLARPQRLSASRALSRREMEIEKALFHGADRQRFLTALYHREEEPQPDDGQTLCSDSLDSVYRAVLRDAGQQALSAKVQGGPSDHSSPQPRQSQNSHFDQSQGDIHSSDQSQSASAGSGQAQRVNSHFDQSQGDIHSSDQSQSGGTGSSQSQRENTTSDQSEPQGSRGLPVSRSLSVSQPIGKLCGVGGGPPVTVTGPVQPISEEEIRANRATVQEIQQIPRFHNYQQGEPSKVLFVRNLSPRASLAQLVSVFSRFQPPCAPVLRYRLLTGRLKGQAFITFPGGSHKPKNKELI